MVLKSASYPIGGILDSFPQSTVYTQAFLAVYDTKQRRNERRKCNPLPGTK